ncbi:unnamed protein product [Blepharisma stoltei]|uniref:Uncharacterized protein n=1 Tax=Blepharisma stoltei TaxID=1481888 RepID=A0AAU9IHC9_9CILI|nr:unnamed protein product [Blepharisma stoltei]
MLIYYPKIIFHHLFHSAKFSKIKLFVSYFLKSQVTWNGRLIKIKYGAKTTKSLKPFRFDFFIRPMPVLIDWKYM